jgi:hypothetical protein
MPFSFMRELPECRAFQIVVATANSAWRRSAWWAGSLTCHFLSRSKTCETRCKLYGTGINLHSPQLDRIAVAVWSCASQVMRSFNCTGSRKELSLENDKHTAYNRFVGLGDTSDCPCDACRARRLLST